MNTLIMKVKSSSLVKRYIVSFCRTHNILLPVLQCSGHYDFSTDLFLQIILITQRANLICGIIEDDKSDLPNDARIIDLYHY